MVGDEIVSNPSDISELAARTPPIGVLDAIGDSSVNPAPSISRPAARDQNPSVTELSPPRGYVHLVSYSEQGPRYAVTVNDEVIVQKSTQPFLDAARALVARGYSGEFQLWDGAQLYPRMQGDIERAAALAVDDTATPRFRNYRQHWRDASKTAADVHVATPVAPSTSRQN